MTVAVCLRCGRRKLGALVTCTACRFDPRPSPVDSAKSILLSDHHMDPAGLDAVGKLIAEGGTPTFAEAGVEEIARAMGSVGAVPLGCRVAVWTPIVVLVGLVGLCVFLWLSR